MDKKYLGKTVALPKDVYDALVEMQEKLNRQLGFKPSISETISYLIKKQEN